MAATQSNSHIATDWPRIVQRVDFSSIDPNLDEDVTLKGPSGLAPASVRFVTINPATDNSAVHGVWDPDNNDTSNNTITVRFHSTGDPAGAIVRAEIEWEGVASGGIS